MDDYFVLGDKILAALVESGKQIYPAEDADNMFAVSKAFLDNVFNTRAFCHYAMGGGIEEEDLTLVHGGTEFSGISTEFKKGNQTALPALDGKVISGNGKILSPGPILPSLKPTVFMAFNTATTEMVAAALPDATINQVNEAILAEPYDQPLELTFIEKGPPSFSSTLKASAAKNAACQCSKKITVSAGEIDPEDEEEDLPECDECGEEISEKAYANCKTCNTTLCSKCHVDLPENEIQAAITNMVGPVEQDGRPLSKEYVLFVDAEKDIPSSCASKGVVSVGQFVAKLQENNPGTNLCVVVLADSYESLRDHKMMIFFVPLLVECCSNVIFALKSELNQCKDLFCGAKYPTETVTLLMSRNMVPFPRLHFFTFGTNMGQEIKDGSIICSAFTLADTTKGSSIPTEKFVAGYTNRKGFLNIPKPDGSSSLDHVLSGVEGANVTVINNLQMTKDLCEGWTAWVKEGTNEDDEGEALAALYSEYTGVKFDEECYGVIGEALENTRDLIAEHGQYMNKEEEEDEEE